MRIILGIIVLFVVVSSVAADSQRTGWNDQERTAVLGELAQRSGLPEIELNRLLASCDSNQQSMYFCAWRDQIVAERAFRRELADKQRQMPRCKKAIETKIASWIRARDQSCDKSATKEWGEGSMKATALVLCISAETIKMTEQLERINRCKFR